MTENCEAAEAVMIGSWKEYSKRYKNLNIIIINN